jgi:hypothetical protein
MNLDARLLAICNVAASVRYSGQYEESTPYFEMANFLEAPTAIVAGFEGVNAILVGRIAVESNYPGAPAVNKTVMCYRSTLSPDDRSRPPGQRLADWCQNFEALLVQWITGVGLCHQGFANALNSIAREPLNVWPMIPADEPIVFTGHSKGGMAQLAALVYWLQHRDRGAVECVTFGSPRVGGSAFATAISNSGVTIRRYENAVDCVPRVPFEPRVAELLARIFQIDCLKTADYHSAGSLRFIGRDGVVLSPQSIEEEFLVEAKAIAALGLGATTGGFEAVRDAHSIAMNSGYWNAVNPKPES